MNDIILRSFFEDRLGAAIYNQNTNITFHVRNYLNDLLMNITNNKYDLSVCIAELYVEYCESQTLDRRAEILQQIGDTTLTLCGFFPKSLVRKQTGIKYYVETGSSAYDNLSILKHDKILFSQLSKQYNDCVSLLNEVSIYNDIKSIDDMENIYTIWSQTNSKALRTILIKHGMLCIKAES